MLQAQVAVPLADAPLVDARDEAIARAAPSAPSWKRANLVEGRAVDELADERLHLGEVLVDVARRITCGAPSAGVGRASPRNAASRPASAASALGPQQRRGRASPRALASSGRRRMCTAQSTIGPAPPTAQPSGDARTGSTPEVDVRARGAG